MKSWRSIFASLVLCTSMSGVSLTAQVADTIVVTIQGDVSQVLLASEYVTPPRIGDTVFFRAQAFDSEGDSVTSVVFHWASEDTTALRIEELPDGRARGIALKKATVLLWVMVEPITSMATGILNPDGTLDWGRRVEFTALGQQVQLCGYLHRNGVLVAESPGPPTCPVVFVAEPLPTVWPMPHVDRRIPWSQFARFASRVR